MTGNRIITTRPSDTEIVMSRVFDAPRELVFEAHTSCEHFVHWWGPQTSTSASAAPGGS